MDNFYNRFKELPLPTKNSGISFCAFEVAPAIKVWIGKDSEARPSLIIQSPNANISTPPIVLENLSVLHNARCNIKVGSSSLNAEGISLLSCTSDDISLQEYFFLVISSFLNNIEKPFSADYLSTVISHLTKLFRALTQDPKKTIQGLWSELFIIASSKDCSFALDSWHSIPEEQFDFGYLNFRLEVKSTSTGIRKHYFNLSQLFLQPPIKGFIASLFVERFGNGSSISDLLFEIRPKISQNALIKLENEVLSTLGSSWKSINIDRFDLETAKKSLAIFSAETIPRVLTPLPAEVSEVHFLSDLSALKPIQMSSLSDSIFFNSIIPRFYSHD